MVNKLTKLCYKSVWYPIRNLILFIQYCIENTAEIYIAKFQATNIYKEPHTIYLKKSFSHTLISVLVCPFHLLTLTRHSIYILNKKLYYIPFVLLLK